VAGAMDGTEGEATGVGFSVSSNVVVDLVHGPFVLNVPVHVSDPVLSSDGGHGAIDISGVVEHLVSTLEGFVDPLRSLRLDGVVDLVGAEVPGLDFLRDVEGGLNISLVEVADERGAPGARRELVSLGVSSSQPGSVVSGTPGVSFIKFLLRAVELGVGSEAVTDSEDVVDVDFASKAVEFVKVASALSSDVGAVGTGEVTVSGLNLIMESGVVKRVPVAHVDEGGGSIELPVGDSVSDSKALEEGLEDGVVLTVGGVVLVDVVGHVGHVDSSVRFTGQPEVVLLEFGVLLVEGQDDGEVIFTGGLIIESAVLDTSASRVTDSSGLIDPEHVHLLVPGLGVLVPRSLHVSRVDIERSVLLSESQHGGASGTTISPDHDRRVS